LTAPDNIGYNVAVTVSVQWPPWRAGRGAACEPVRARPVTAFWIVVAAFAATMSGVTLPTPALPAPPAGASRALNLSRLHHDTPRSHRGEAMRTVEANAALTAGPDRVWACLANPARWNEWLTLHKSWKGEPPAAVEGQGATATATAMNMPITIDWTFETVDTPHTLVMDGITRAGVKLRLAITLAARDAGTLVDVNATVDGGMIDGPMGAVFKKSLTSALDKSLRKLEVLAR
jgi:uncharacterized protein YndB with AHSA1/START domain